MTFATLPLAPVLDDEDGTDNTFNMTWPSDIISGETLIAWIINAGNNIITTPETGFNEISTEFGGGTLAGHCLWYKGTGLETGTADFLFNGTPAKSGYLFRVTGAADPDVSPPEAVDTNADNANPDTPSITASWGGNEDNLLLSLVGWDEDGTEVTVSVFPYADNNTDDFAAGNQRHIAICSAEIAADTDNPGAYTILNTQRWIGPTVVLRPAVTGGPPTFLSAQGVMLNP